MYKYKIFNNIASDGLDYLQDENLILNDDGAYIKIKKNLFNLRNSRNYLNVKNDLMKILKIND